MRIGYFLYDESHSGVIDSQAIDVVRFFNEQTDHEAILLAALPFRSRHEVMSKFRAVLPTPILSMVALPQRLQAVGFRLEARRFAQLLKAAEVDVLVCRNALACDLALHARSAASFEREVAICYDGRGALKAEAQEFHVYPEYLKRLLLRAEQRAVLRADYRIAVTEELVEWWRTEFGYASDFHAVIPTTTSTRAEGFDPRLTREEWRKHYGFTSTDVVLAFAGGRADWQGLSNWLPEMNTWLHRMPELKLLLLAPAHPSIAEMQESHPHRIVNAFVPHEDVLKALSAADHGILWREVNVTNRVASPTKLSEYLQAGLSVIANAGTATGRIVEASGIGVCIDPPFQNEYPSILSSARSRSATLNLTKGNFYPSLIDKIVRSSG